MDVVIPYRFSYSTELLYCLRSLKNLEHGKVFIIGDKPKFKVNHIQYDQTSDIAKNTLGIINLACNSPEISDEFIWMADDIFILNKTEIPIHHRGPYTDVLKSYEKQHKHNYYTQRMRATYTKLIQLGIENPLCYELHIPFVVNKAKWNEISKYIKPYHNKLSMYANLNNMGGTKISDVKVRGKDSIPDGNFISTHDSTFGVNQAGKMIRSKFNEKGKYEFKG